MVINSQLEHRLMVIHEDRLQLTQHTDLMFCQRILDKILIFIAVNSKAI